jgi:hypothetical protein
MKNLFATVLLSLVFLAISAQPGYKSGYIINTEGDTLYGYISFLGNSGYDYSTCRFKREISAFRTFYSYTPLELKSIMIRNKQYYEPTKMPYKGENTTLFAEILVKGRLSLLCLNEEFYIQNNDTIIALNKAISDSVQTDTNRFYKKLLREQLTGCAEIQTKINTISLKRNQLFKLFTDYYSCTGETYQVYKSVFEWPSVSFAVFGGFSLSAISFESYEPGFDYLTVASWEHSTGPVIGIRSYLHFKQMNKNLSVTAELVYTNSSFHDTTYSNFPNDLKNTLDYKLSTIKIPLGLQQKLSDRKFSPFINFGFSNSFHIESKTHREETNLAGITKIKEVPPVKTYQLGLYIGGGIKYQLIDNYDIFLEFRYEKPNQIISKRMKNQEDLFINLDNFFFVMGIHF